MLISNHYRQLRLKIKGSGLSTTLLVFIAWLCVAIFSLVLMPNLVYQSNLPQLRSFTEIASTRDAAAYIRIADAGYTYKYLTAYFPLYPLIMRLIAKILQIKIFTAGLILNLASTAVSFHVFYLLAIDFFGNKKNALNALMLFAFYPMTFYLAGIYTEPLFCALGFSAFYLARKNKWVAADVLLCLIAATRPTGIAFALALLVDYLFFTNKKTLWPSLFCLVVPLGLLGYMLYLNIVFNDPFLFFHVQSAVGHQNLGINYIKTIFLEIGRISSLAGLFLNGKLDLRELIMEIIRFSPWLIATMLLLANLKKAPTSYTIFSVILILCSISAGDFISVPRYLLPAFPIFFYATSLFNKRPELFLVTIAGSAAALSILYFAFSTGLWFFAY